MANFTKQGKFHIDDFTYLPELVMNGLKFILDFKKWFCQYWLEAACIASHI